jgi:hypothetical protein
VSAIAQRRADVTHLAAGAIPARHPALWLALLAFVLYLPPAVSVVQLNADAVEHVDIARRLLAGEGYALGVKGYFLGDSGVLHDGLDERPPLYPLLLAGLLRAGLGLPAAQVVNALLAAACAALVYAIGSALFGRRTASLAGLLAALSPPVLAWMVPPMTEALAIFLALLATWLLVRELDAPRVGSFAAAGTALGLGYLARPTMAVSAAALLLGVVLASRERHRLLRPLLALALGVAIFAAPITLYSLATRGSPSYSGQSYLYSVFDDDEVGQPPFGRSLPPPGQFIMANREFVVAAMGRNIRAYAGEIFLDPRWLLLLLPAWPAALLALVRGRYPPAAWPVLLLAGANFFLYALTWANHQLRYQLLTLLLLLPFAVDGLARLGLPRLRLGSRPSLTALHLAVASIGLLWLQSFFDEYRGQYRYFNEPVEPRLDYGLRWTGPSGWVKLRDLPQTMDWITAHTEPGDVLAHHAPWLSTFFTERPSTRMPSRPDPDTLRRFLVDYRVAYVLLSTDDYRRRYQESLQALQSAGVRPLTVAGYPAFDTRALWQ